MSHTESPTHTLPDDHMAIIRELKTQLNQYQDRIQQLEYKVRNREGPVIPENSRAATLNIYEALAKNYPAIKETNFFDAELPKDHQIFNWHDFYYTEGMIYEAPPVPEQAKVRLTGYSKQHEQDLATIQGFIANTTRFYDTLAHELTESGDFSPDRIFNFLNLVRISAANDASKINKMRRDIYLKHTGTNVRTADKVRALLARESSVAAKPPGVMRQTPSPELNSSTRTIQSAGGTTGRRPLGPFACTRKGYLRLQRQGLLPSYIHHTQEKDSQSRALNQPSLIQPAHLSTQIKDQDTKADLPDATPRRPDDERQPPRSDSSNSNTPDISQIPTLQTGDNTKSTLDSAFRPISFPIRPRNDLTTGASMGTRERNTSIGAPRRLSAENGSGPSHREGKGETHLVEDSPIKMERPETPPPANESGCLHGSVGGDLGHHDGGQGDTQEIDRSSAPSPHP
ncbi:hypothetical protein BGW42_002384 [Actinomortierella wolfii]|nr:hypothetical protein BGW42_002384 [Actinomortierella wolfii]